MLLVLVLVWSWLGAATSVEVSLRARAGSRFIRWMGKTRTQLDLRGVTVASVLAIARGEKRVIVPMASEILRAGDVLALAGTRYAIGAAEDVVKSTGAGDAPSESEPGEVRCDP